MMKLEDEEDNSRHPVSKEQYEEIRVDSVSGIHMKDESSSLLRDPTFNEKFHRASFDAWHYTKTNFGWQTIKIGIITIIMVFAMIIFFATKEDQISISRVVVSPGRPIYFQIQEPYDISEVAIHLETTDELSYYGSQQIFGESGSAAGSFDNTDTNPLSNRLPLLTRYAPIRRSSKLSTFAPYPHAFVPMIKNTAQSTSPVSNLTRTVSIALQGTLSVIDENTPSSTDIILENTTLSIPPDPTEEIVHQFDVSKPMQKVFTNFKLILINDQFQNGDFVITLSLLQMRAIAHYEVLISAFILVFVYVLIIFELVHRTIAAMLGSFVALACLSAIRVRPGFLEVVSWIDFDTVGLLFGMMVMVGIFANTGFFEYAAVKSYKYSKGNIWVLTCILCIFIAFLSCLLDNVTTILLLAPATMRLCKVINVPAIPLLITEVLFSNIGGAITPIGDPTNIIIVNDRRVRASGVITFVGFTIHIGLGIIMMMPPLLYFSKKLNEHVLKRDPTLGIQRVIDAWKKAASKLKFVHGSEEEKVRVELEDHIHKLEEDKVVEEDSLKKAEDQAIISGEIPGLKEMEEKYVIHDVPLFITTVIVLGIVIFFFFIHSFVKFEISMVWIAIVGAMIHLVVAGIHDVEHALEKVEFGTLLFFAALFVLMRCLEELGLIEWIGHQTAAAIGTVPDGKGRLIVALLLILWISGLVSSFIDNIPFTTTMVPVVYSLHQSLGLPLGPLIWSIVFGTSFGGNGTLIGASANVVACGLAEQNGIHISFNTFFKYGFPFMIVSLFLSTIYLLVFYVLIPWY